MYLYFDDKGFKKGGFSDKFPAFILGLDSILNSEVWSDFEFNDYQYCDEKKASGSLKITSFKGNLMNYYNYTVFENCCAISF